MQNSSEASLQKRRKALYYYAAYSAAFLIVSFLVFSPFILDGKTFVWHHDGLKQHLTALTYYGMWLRDIADGLFSGRGFYAPTFSFGLGYGGDIVGYLAYYCIGDPLALLSALVPKDYTVHLYDFLVVLRIYLAGIAFSAYVRYTFTPSRLGVLVGALTYAFCGYVLYAAVRHPFFTNPLIYLPVVLLGVELVLKERKPVFFVIGIALSAASNFYFFYMIFVLMALYIILRLAFRFGERRVKGSFADFGWLVGFGVIGVLISCAIFLPAVLFFLQDARSGSQVDVPSLYAKTYYYKLALDMLISNPPSNWTRISLTVPAFMAVVALFMERKKFTQLKVALAVLLAFLLIPYVGYALNGFSYVANRWCWAFSLACACAVAVMWDKLMGLRLRKLAGVGIITVAFVAFACFVNRKNLTHPTVATVLVFCIACVLLIVTCSIVKSKSRQALCSGVSSAATLFVVTACIVVNGLVYYHPHFMSYTTDFLTPEEAASGLSYEAEPLADIDDADFYRFSSSEKLGTTNSGLLFGKSSTKLYWSLCNSNVVRYFDAMGIDASAHYGNVWRDLNSISFLNELANVKYYLAPQKDHRLFGYADDPLVSFNRSGHKSFAVYENKNPLPFGYTYSSTIGEDDFDSLSPAKRRECIMQACMLSGTADGSVSPNELKFTAKELPYEIEYAEGSEPVDGMPGAIRATNKNSSVVLKCDGLANCETFIEFTELASTSQTDFFSLPIEFTYEDGSKQTRSVIITSTNAPRYHHRRWQTICAGYSTEAVSLIKIKFPKAVTYSYENLRVYVQPMGNFDEYVSRLTDNTLEDVDLHYLSDATAASNSITGFIALDEPKVLCTAIPFSGGWRVRVDGQDANIRQVNVMFLGVELDKGSHKVEFAYETPGLALGLMLTCLGVLAYAGYEIIRRSDFGKRRFSAYE